MRYLVATYVVTVLLQFTWCVSRQKS